LEINLAILAFRALVTRRATRRLGVFLATRLTCRLECRLEAAFLWTRRDLRDLTLTGIFILTRKKK